MKRLDFKNKTNTVWNQIAYIQEQKIFSHFLINLPRLHT